MADFESPRPVEMEKAGAFLHDRSNRPKSPAASRTDVWAQYFPLLVAIVAALAMVALTFQTRASWGVHRDWVVPVTVPLLVAGGLGFGHLLARREWGPLIPAFIVFAGILALTALDIWYDAQDTEDGVRDMMAATNGFLLGLAVITSVGALIWVERQRPARAPTSEV